MYMGGINQKFTPNLATTLIEYKNIHNLKLCMNIL